MEETSPLGNLVSRAFWEREVGPLNIVYNTRVNTLHFTPYMKYYII